MFFYVFILKILSIMFVLRKSWLLKKKRCMNINYRNPLRNPALLGY